MNNFDKGREAAREAGATTLIDLSAYKHFPFEHRAFEEGWNANDRNTHSCKDDSFNEMNNCKACCSPFLTVKEEQR